MAEPLTSSDIWRIEAGWGTSPMASPEERRRFAAAGEIPLSSENVARLAEGRGISPMASAAEKEAWKMGEYMTGRREQAPVEYGGIGDRPTGTSRRSIRMQAEYDEAQKQALEQQRIMQQMDLQQRAESRLQRSQDLEMEKYRLGEERESRVIDEAGMIVDAIRGAVGPDGKVIANPIRPEDDNAIERLEGLGRFKFGMENKSAQDMWSNLYNDALKFREDKINQSKQQELAAINLSVRTGKPFEEFGTYNEQGMFQPKLQGMIAGAEEVKAGEEAKAQEATIATEKRRAETAADVAEERDKKARRKQLDEDILTEEQTLIDFQNQKQSPSRDTEIKKAEAKLKNLHLRRGSIEGLTSDDLIYKDQDAYKNAVQGGKKIPSGTTIYIGGIPAKVK